MSALALLREAWRSLRRSIGTTLAASVLLGAGFAISLMVSSIAVVAFDGFDSPVAASVNVVGERDGAGNVRVTLGTDILRLRAAAPEVFANAAAVRSLPLTLNDSRNTRNQSLDGALVDGPLFANLGWEMLHGRGFLPEDAARGAVILSHDVWKNRYGSNPDLVNSVVRVDGREVTVVGVLPPFRSYPFHEQVYLAHTLDERSPLVGRYWELNLRVDTPAVAEALGRAVAAVQAERLKLLGDSALQAPLGFRSHRGNGVPAESQVMINTLLTMGALLLLLASSNAGGLLLVHWLARTRELATRAALGGTRRRLAAVCLLQSLLLVGLALLLAHGCAAVLLQVLERYLHSNPDGIPTYSRLSLHPGATWPVLLAALGCVILVAAPVLWRLRGNDLQARIRSGDRGSSARSWLGSGLFAVQCLLSAVTVLIALLCAQGARELLAQQTGLNTAQVLTARINNADPIEQERLGRALLRAVEQLPAASAVSMAGSLPLALQAQRGVEIGTQRWELGHNPVDAAFAEVYQVPMLTGSWFSPAQVEADAAVAVLDRSAADLLYPGVSAIGRSYTQIHADGTRRVYTVIGVTQAIRTDNSGGADQPSLFTPMSWRSAGGLVLSLRTRGPDPLSLAPELERLAAEVDPALALGSLRSFAQVQHAAGSGYRLIALLFGPLGVLALLLAATGLAALLGSLVARRMRELGIRRALGAGPLALLRPLLQQLGLWGTTGLLAGLALSWPLAQTLDAGVFGGEVLGVLTYGSTLLVIAAALMLAATPPVRRALRVDPISVLRQD